MASIFTFDPDPPRISSPWPASDVNSPETIAVPPEDKHQNGKIQGSSSSVWPSSVIPGPGVSRLEAEPQEGPTEYKLHLLLRPRKSLCSSTTGTFVPGSQHSRSAASTPRSVSEASLSVAAPAAASNNTRQHRLEQLTTQLLWRLQQSSPHHSTSATNLILPSLPEAKPQMQPPDRPAKLLPGLEESKGALYEIGVSDDGALIGLTTEEMTESLNNLKSMAASLGCSMDVLRMICVGECEWLEPAAGELPLHPPVTQKGELYVAEAYIKPDFRSQELLKQSELQDRSHRPSDHHTNSSLAASNSPSRQAAEPLKDQLRVSLTGATTCGKSSLLGTLSTSTLDNSRGKSRLSMLKHRHEIASGVTSSVVQELIGYHDDKTDKTISTEVVNYATENVSSWTDIHVASSPGRLSLVSDSAGHPRYRRTTVRGLIGWAPHWIFLCIAANVDSSSNDMSHTSTNEDEEASFLGANAHISIAHLDLCLKLQVPLVVVVTKFDLATKSNFRPVLSTLLTHLKDAGRTPELLSNSNALVTEDDLQKIPQDEISEVLRVTTAMKRQPVKTVPILFTSAVKGTGITKLHALLRYLPILGTTPNPHERNASRRRPSKEAAPNTFHIDDIFNMPVNKMDGSDTAAQPSTNTGSVLSGHIGNGSLAVGDDLWLGPFSDSATHNPMTSLLEDAQPSTSEQSSGFLTPRSFNDALVKVTSSAKLRSPPTDTEWRRVKAASIRNLRMPVHVLHQDQVGTIGILPVAEQHDAHDKAVSNVINIPGRRALSHQPAGNAISQHHQHHHQQLLPIRKGMVLVSGGRPSSAHTFTADFHLDEASSIVVGTMVLIYSASVRASAKVVAVALHNSTSRAHSPQRDGSDRRSISSRDSETNRFNDERGAEKRPDDGDDDDEDSFGFGFRFDGDEEQRHDGRDAAKETSRATRLRSNSPGSSAHGSDEGSLESILVTFQLVTYREWLEKGATVLIMPGGGPGWHGGTETGVKGIGGLEGVVGQIVQTFG